jgi:hypothetical protein
MRFDVLCVFIWLSFGGARETRKYWGAQHRDPHQSKKFINFKTIQIPTTPLWSLGSEIYSKITGIIIRVITNNL